MLKINKKNKPEKILIGDEVYILWQDGHESRISFFELGMPVLVQVVLMN